MTRIWQEFSSAIRDNVFCLLVLAGILGFADQSGWVVVPLIAALLTLWSNARVQHWFDDFKRVGRLYALAYFWLACLG